MLLSALLYYRAVSIQRFLEPALALSQPRNHFAEEINSLINWEFGSDENRPIQFIMGSIYVEEQLLFDQWGRLRESAPDTIRKLGKIFLSLMTDSHINRYIDMVLVCSHYPFSPNGETDMRMRMMREKSDIVLRQLFMTEPQLQERFGPYFASSNTPVDFSKKRVDLIEFRIVPSEQLHIDVLQRLRKYVN